MVDNEDVLEEKGPQTKKLMMIIVIISVLFMGIMGAGFYVIWNKVTPPDPDASEEQNKNTDGDKNATEIKPLCSLDAFVVNLSDQGETKYLRTKMDLEVTNEDTNAELKKRLPQVRNAILMIIPERTSKELKTMEGKNTMRNEIMECLNSFIKNGQITNIYFTEFVIQ